MRYHNHYKRCLRSLLELSEAFLFFQNGRNVATRFSSLFPSEFFVLYDSDSDGCSSMYKIHSLSLICTSARDERNGPIFLVQNTKPSTTSGVSRTLYSDRPSCST